MQEEEEAMPSFGYCWVPFLVLSQLSSLLVFWHGRKEFSGGIKDATRS
jgi:hypothetical protein